LFFLLAEPVRPARQRSMPRRGDLVQLHCPEGGEQVRLLRRAIGAQPRGLAGPVLLGVAQPLARRLGERGVGPLGAGVGALARIIERVAPPLLRAAPGRVK
jgi:hypothetical protein